jgi:hypothetical protein
MVSAEEGLECGGGPRARLASEALLGASGAVGAELASCSCCWAGCAEGAGLEDLT